MKYSGDSRNNYWKLTNYVKFPMEFLRFIGRKIKNPHFCGLCAYQ